MSKTHKFSDGTIVELDDGVEVADFLNADLEKGLGPEGYAALVAKAEAEVKRLREAEKAEARK